MLGRDNIIGVLRHTLADILGIDETDVTLDALLHDDLGLEADDLEEVVAYLQGILEIHIAPDDLFPEDTYDRLTVESVVNSLQQQIDNA